MNWEKRGIRLWNGGGDSDGVKNYASAEQIIIFRAGEVSIRHFIGMPLILVERTGMNLQNEET